jgi:hypothetical protein
VFHPPPWKELSCKPQTALAQAQQEHGFCVKQLFVVKTVLTQKHWFCSNHGLFRFKPKYVCVNQGFRKGHSEKGFGKGHI